ncbi:hypothetical protein GCM10017779_66870 [Streptomyces capillispiralis]|nr:hypothetical protein GCM10017779_66870 [Streptomyces capillispiralis]
MPGAARRHQDPVGLDEPVQTLRAVQFLAGDRVLTHGERLDDFQQGMRLLNACCVVSLHHEPEPYDRALTVALP